MRRLRGVPTGRGAALGAALGVALRLERASVALVASLALGLAVLGPPPARGGSAEWLAVQHVRDALPAGSVLVTDPLTDAIQAMRFLDEPVPDPGGPAHATRAWIRERAPAFGLDTLTGDLRIERDTPLADGRRRVRLRQLWRGIPVEGADVTAVLSAQGRLRALAANLVPRLSPPAVPRIDRTDAVARAARGTRSALERSPAGAELWARRTPAGDRLAWRVELPARASDAAGSPAGPPLVRWVDAESGACTDAADACARAVGYVYPTDPRQPFAEVPLLRLNPGSGLWNDDLRVEDQLDPEVESRGLGGDYRYLPTESGFDQVNAYWHADRFVHDWLGALGYAGPPDSLVVRVNAAIEPNVALATGRFVLFGRPIAGFCREPARANDILAHELTHAVLYGNGIEPGGPRREGNALHEGLADYFAAATTGDPAIGEWLYLTFPTGATRVDQPADPWHMRNYDHVGFAGAPGSSAWANGMILSAALWDLRAVLGRTCDSLVLESLDYLPSVPTWATFANAMLQADQDRHASRNLGAIVQAMANRGIQGSVVAAITGPTTLPPGEEGRFVAQSCCEGAVGLYRWEARPWCRGAPCGEWRPLGTGPELRTSFDEDTELRLEVTSPWSDVLLARRFVGVRDPELMVFGPRRVVEGREATWTARVSAMAPFRVQWLRQWQGSGPGTTFLGEGPTTTFAVERPCRIEVLLIDGLFRIARTTLDIATFEDRPPPVANGTLLVRQRSDGHGHAMETSLELPRTGPLRVRVYDVRGRLRANLWDGPATRGEHVVRWDGSSLEPGVYLLRVEAEPTGTVLRFSIVR